MKNVKWIIGIAALLLILVIHANAYCDTLFVGSRPGVLQLTEELQIKGVSKNCPHIKHLVVTDTDRIYCVLPGKVIVLDGRTLAHIESIPIPAGNVCAIEFKNGNVYVLTASTSAYNSRSAVVIISDLQVIEQIDAGMNPSGMAVSPDSAKLYIAKGSESKIDVISADTGELIESISCGGKPSSLALNDTGSKLYAADSAASEVVVMYVGDIRPLGIKRIPVGIDCQKVRPAGQKIYAIDNSAETKAVYVIDTSTDTVTDTIQLDAVPSDAVLSPGGDYTIITSAAGDAIYKVGPYYPLTSISPNKKLPSPYTVAITETTLINTLPISDGGTLPDGGTETEEPEQAAGGVVTLGITPCPDPVRVIYPDGGELISGTCDIIWEETNYHSDDDIYQNAEIKAVVNSTEYLLTSGNVQDLGYWWSDWDTKTIPNIDSANYKIKVSEFTGEEERSDLSEYDFTVDNTPPTVNITDPKEEDQLIPSSPITVKITATDALAGVKDPVTVTVNGTTEYDAYFTVDHYEVSGVAINDGGERNIIEATATDNTNGGYGNEATDTISAFVGWMTHIELPHSVLYEINNVKASSGAATCQIILDVMKTDSGGQLAEQDDIFTAGLPFNHESWTTELDAYGVDGALDDITIDPWGETSPYNFAVKTYEYSQFLDYLRDIACWIGYPVGGIAVAKHIPVAVPKYGYTLQPIWWVAITGVAAASNPYPHPDNIQIHGMWITDPEQGEHNIGTDTYVVASGLYDLLQPAPVDYVSVVEPPEWATGTMELAPPTVNSSTSALVEIAECFNSNPDSLEKHMVDSALVVDMDEANPLVNYRVEGDLLNLFKPTEAMNSPTLCWKDIISPMLLTDKDFRKAIDGALARDFLYVKRLDIDEEYILIPFDKFTEGKFQSYAALIVDKETGAFEQGSWVEEPTRYVQISKDEAIKKVIELHPETAAKVVEARLVWKPGELSGSPFYPFWEVSAGDNKYYVIEK